MEPNSASTCEHANAASRRLRRVEVRAGESTQAIENVLSWSVGDRSVLTVWGDNKVTLATFYTWDSIVAAEVSR